MRISVNHLWVYGLLGPAILIYHLFNRAKLIYVVPLLFIGVVVLQAFQQHNRKQQPQLDKLSIDPMTLQALGLYLFMALMSILHGWPNLAAKTWVRDFGIIMSPLLIYSLRMRFNSNHVKFLFIIFFLSYGFWVRWQFGTISPFSLIKTAYNAENEFDMGVVVGLFVVYFIAQRQWLWLASAIYFMLLVSKRVIYLGLIPGAFSYWVLTSLIQVQNKPSLRLALCALYYGAFAAIALNMRAAATWFLDVLEANGTIPLDKFLMGRIRLLAVLESGLQRNEWHHWLLGHGPGTADWLMLEWLTSRWTPWGVPINPHNDFLKLLYDYGVMGLIGYFFIAYYLYVRSKPGLIVFLFTLPVFLVDNTMIFIVHLMLGGIMARSATPFGVVEPENATMKPKSWLPKIRWQPKY